MNRDEVLTLTKVVAEPAVSILLPVERSAAFHDAERRRAEQLVGQACDVLQRTYPSDIAGPVVQRLHSVAEQLDLSHPGDGLAVFASPQEVHVLDLPFPVDEQLTIERSFATRQLLIGLSRAPRVRVLVLSEHLARLLDDREGELVEIHQGGFPIGITPPREQDAPHRDLPIHEESEAEVHRIVYRAVDDALDRLSAGGPLPVVLVGAERELAYFREVSHHGSRIIGSVHGNYVRAGRDEIERAVRPVIDAHADELDDRAAHEILEGIGAGRVVTDFATIWRAAGEGRGARLVMEEGYELPGQDTGGRTSAGGREGPWTGEDAIDEVIERVVVAGGEIVFVRAGKLASVGGIGLVLRY